MFKSFAVTLFTGVALCSGALAEERGTPDEAKALVEKAIAYVKQVGPEQAFKVFSDPKGEFVVKDLYVWCQNLQGDMVAHGANPALVGKNMLKFKDADGKDFNTEINQNVVSKGEGLTSYRWTHPVSKKIEQKQSYYKRAGDAVCGVGFYAQN